MWLFRLFICIFPRFSAAGRINTAKSAIRNMYDLCLDYLPEPCGRLSILALPLSALNSLQMSRHPNGDALLTLQRRRSSNFSLALPWILGKGCLWTSLSGLIHPTIIAAPSALRLFLNDCWPKSLKLTQGPSLRVVRRAGRVMHRAYKRSCIWTVVFPYRCVPICCTCDHWLQCIHRPRPDAGALRSLARRHGASDHWKTIDRFR